MMPPPPKCNTPQELLELEVDSPQYQSKTFDYLSKSKSSDYRYFFKTFKEIKGNTYMTTNFRNTSTCFEVNLLVLDWEKLEGMKITNGKSYPNELINLKWRIKEEDNEIKIIYHDMDWIRD